MKESEQSIWQKLAPEEALDWAERILKKIEEGTLNPIIYSSLVNRLIAFSDNTGNHQESPELTNDPPASQVSPTKSSYQQGLAQLPPAERTAYLKKKKHWQQNFESRKIGSRKKYANKRK